MLASLLISPLVSYVTANAYAAVVVNFAPKLLTTKAGVVGVFAVGTAVTIAASRLTTKAVEKILPE